MKHILCTGCSFTKNVRFNPDTPFNQGPEERYSWPYYLQKELGDDVLVYNLGGATNDNVSMCRIIFYWIQKLIKEGVDVKDIHTIIQWSDPTRQSIYITNDNPRKIIEQAHTLMYWDNWKDENGLFFLTGGYAPPDDALDGLGIDNAVKYWELEVNWNNILNQTISWLEAWSHLVLFFDKNGIQHNYMSMRNPYSYEAREALFGAPQNNSDIPTKTIWFDKHEILKPYINGLPIDSKLHWHYKNYNGLLEWTIDNHNDISPFQESNGLSYSEYLKIQPNGWGHPSPQMMEKFIKNEFIKLWKI
jgi:hypothetical protein